jgi:hypothetical protein
VGNAAGLLSLIAVSAFGSAAAHSQVELPQVIGQENPHQWSNIKRVVLSCMTIFHNLGATLWIRPEECDGRPTADTSKQAERGADCLGQP